MKKKARLSAWSLIFFCNAILMSSLLTNTYTQDLYLFISVYLHRNGVSCLRRRAASVFGIGPDTEAESGQCKPYLALCYCLAASTTTKKALFWTVQEDLQIQDGKKETVAPRD